MSELDPASGEDMAADSDSQRTIYEPMQQAFATLTPANTAARIAFHEVVEAAFLPQQLPGHDTPHHTKFMSVNAEPEYDRDASLPRSDFDSGAVSDTPTDPDTESEQEVSEVGKIWTGCYFFKISVFTVRPDLGWIAGKGRPGEDPDFLLTTKQRPHGIRGRHAFFTLNPDTGFLSISRASKAALDLYVDGVPIKGQYAFNKGQARIRVGSLEYFLRYTEYARDSAYYEERNQYLTTIYGLTKISHPAMTPTPAPHSISVGAWTLTASAGKGGFGKVSFASNTRNELVAVKMMERSSITEGHIAKEVATFRELTELVREENEPRLVQLREVIYQYGKEKYHPPGLEEVSFILEPAVRRTFSELIYSNSRSNKWVNGYDVTVEDSAPGLTRIHLFHDALLGVQFLHEHGWIHGDLKPANIGIEAIDRRGKDSIPWRAVLLDLGDAIKTNGKKVIARAGQGGTVNYLAPERELYDFDDSVDIWSMGVVGYELLRGRHPWKFSKNPWRKGVEYEYLREQWHGKYEHAMDRLSEDEELGALLSRMLRHRWARDKEQCRRRITIQETLNHRCWEMFGDAFVQNEDRPTKRTRTSN